MWPEYKIAMKLGYIESRKKGDNFTMSIKWQFCMGILPVENHYVTGIGWYTK